MDILIHHHTLVYIDENGLWVRSFIGAWIETIAQSQNINKVGLLAHSTNSHNPNLDYCVKIDNLFLEDLGINHGRKNRYARNLYIKNVCKNITGYDYLLVRGITPRQRIVVKYTPKTLIKNFLLVGSLKENKLSKVRSLMDIFQTFLIRYRKWELKKIRNSLRFFANSPKLVEEIRDVLSKNAEFVPTNTIKHSNFKWKKSFNTDDSRTLLFVGRVEKAKGIEELIQAFNQLPSNIEWTLNIVGPIEEDYKLYLTSLLKERTQNVIFHGFIPFGEKLFEFYDRSDLYILPSYHEGFPHTIWEAGARSIPVICTPVGGIPALVNESMVQFIPKQNTQQLYYAILEHFNKNKNDVYKQRMQLWEMTEQITVDSAVKILIQYLNSSDE
jgi:glycosyltransferase involved in cell wall biosynthesis